MRSERLKKIIQKTDKKIRERRILRLGCITAGESWRFIEHLITINRFADENKVHFNYFTSIRIIDDEKIEKDVWYDCCSPYCKVDVVDSGIHPTEFGGDWVSGNDIHPNTSIRHTPYGFLNLHIDGKVPGKIGVKLEFQRLECYEYDEPNPEHRPHMVCCDHVFWPLKEYDGHWQGIYLRFDDNYPTDIILKNILYLNYLYLNKKYDIMKFYVNNVHNTYTFFNYVSTTEINWYLNTQVHAMKQSKKKKVLKLWW